MQIQSLSDDELDYLDEVLTAYGNDLSILDVSELDGFFTALVVGPNVIELEDWYPALWGGELLVPELESEEEAEQLQELLLRLLNAIEEQLHNAPDDFTALFGEGEFEGEEVTVVEEWCFGFMRGLDLADWPGLSGAEEKLLEAITLHGDEANFPKLEAMTMDEHQDTVANIEPAVRSLYKHFHD